MKVAGILPFDHLNCINWFSILITVQIFTAALNVFSEKELKEITDLITPLARRQQIL